MTQFALAGRRFHILVMAKGSAHFVKAGQITMHDEPPRGAEIVIEEDGRMIRGRVDQVHIPPGCDEHCLGTIFLREI